MNKKQLLLEREFKVNGNWHSILNKLREFKSVEFANFFDTTSSAGDWGGFIVQKIKDVRYLILFYQENNFPRSGFTITTESHPLSKWNGLLQPHDVLEIISDYMYIAEDRG